MNKAYVYRYIDKEDSIVKYYGIVYGKTRSLEQRLKEHERNDDWCKNGSWIIEYIKVNNRTEAELYEAHYIAIDKTYNYFNKAKANWGECSFIPNRDKDWKNIDYNFTLNGNETSEYIYRVDLENENDILYPMLYSYKISKIPMVKRKIKIKEDGYVNYLCNKCGSDDISLVGNNGIGQLYCNDCGAWVAQGTRDAKKLYTPSYSGKYKKENGEIVSITKYSFLNTRGQTRYFNNSFTKKELEMVARTKVIGHNKFCIHTYALTDEDINYAKQRIVAHIKNQLEVDVLALENKKEELQKELPKITNDIDKNKQKLNVFMSQFNRLYCCQ